MKKLNILKEEAPEILIGCMTASLREGNETQELFARSWLRWLSPLVWRAPTLLWSCVIISLSIINFWGPREKFLLYMTHWGLLLIFWESLFGVIVTVKKTPECLTGKEDGLPWYVRTYWILYNISIPIAFLVTLFYWAVIRLPDTKIDYAPNPIMDIMLHGVNSGLMFVELVLSSHPTRLLHIMQPMYFAGVYLLFGVVYYLSGGLDPWGNVFIYPVIDWSKPKTAMVTVSLTGLFLAVMHIIALIIASLRDYLVKKYTKENHGKYNDNFVA